jgi:predicted O-methyltransferase YrrM
VIAKLSKVVAAARAAGRSPGPYLRAAARLPLEQQAEACIAALPAIELPELTSGATNVRIRLPSARDRHPWSLGVAEQLILQTLVQARHCRTAFEIGTFNGGTTRLIAEALPDEGEIWTIDLPPAQFSATQAPEDFEASDVGAAYRDSPSASKVTQLFGDSLRFDFTPYAASADLVLVDGGHEYEHGVADTATALSLVKPGGVILWDDFAPYWHGLVSGICEAMAGRRLGRLPGTSFAAFLDERPA